MKKLCFVVVSALCGLAMAAPMVSSSGVRAELKSGSSPLFESVGKDADALPLDWPAAATKAVVTLVRNGKETVVEIDDTTVETITLAVPTAAKDEAQVEVSVAYCDANGIARRTDQAVVFAVIGVNGAAGKFNSNEVGSNGWSKYSEKAPVVPTLAKDDAVTLDGETLGVSGSFYRQFPKGKNGVTAKAGLTASDGSYELSVDVVRNGQGLIFILK